MKKITRHILKSVLFLTVLFNSIVLSAQIGKPVTVIVSLTPPYTPFLNEYASFETNKLQVTLITNDSRMQNYPVKLQMFVQRYGTGIVMQTAEYAAVPPIYLTGGTSEILDGASLSPYFSAQNNVFGGFDQSQYIQTGRIPDGQYRIGFRVTDAKRSNVILSETVYSQPGWFLLNDPPQLNLPLNGAAEEVQNIQNVKLEWFPRHLGSLNSAFAVNYLAELYALRVPGTNPATVVASLPPDFTVVTRQNSFNLTQNEYVLEPGVEYAWRVKAYADNGLTLFQNNGYSEVRTFVYGSLCPEVENIHADILGTEEVEFSWDTDPKQTAWEIQLRKENSEDNWYTRQTSTVPLNIKNILSEGTAYEYRIKALCNFNESDYSPLKSFSTEVFQLPENFECGAGDSIEITNFNPKLSLYVGEIIYNGKFPVKLTEINGSNGTFSGKGRMRIPMLANVQVNMQFENIKVNELNQVYEGEMVSVYNPDSPFFIDDITDYFAEGDQVGNIITGQDSAAITLGYPIDDNTTIIINNDGTITINTGGGSTAETVDDLENGTTIEDSEGNLYAVDADGNITEIGTSGDDVSPEDYSNNANQYNQLDSTITLTFENNGTWAFDSRNPDYANSPFDKEYQKLGDYYVPWKFIPLGKSDKIKARITKGNIEDPNKVKFLTPAGTEFFAEYNNGYYELEATGGKIGDGIEVYAIYMPDDSTKRSLGKLRIASYPHKEMKVTCVPAGDFNIDNKISEALLNQIYAPYYINWTVTLDEPFTDNSWDTGDEGLQVSGSGFWSEYTEEMRALRDVYTEKRGIDEESLYLFFFPNGNSDENQLLGDMPLKSRFGFIFNVSSESKEKIARTVAHELAHGAFQLKHTFSNKYKIKKYSTQNLTDYNGGTELVKYQWDVIHDPQNKLFNWMQGEGEGMDYFENLTKSFVRAIKIIRCTKQNNQQFANIYFPLSSFSVKIGEVASALGWTAQDYPEEKINIFISNSEEVRTSTYYEDIFNVNSIQYNNFEAVISGNKKTIFFSSSTNSDHRQYVFDFIKQLLNTNINISVVPSIDANSLSIDKLQYEPLCTYNLINDNRRIELLTDLSNYTFLHNKVEKVAINLLKTAQNKNTLYNFINNNKTITFNLYDKIDTYRKDFFLSLSSLCKNVWTQSDYENAHYFILIDEILDGMPDFTYHYFRQLETNKLAGIYYTENGKYKFGNVLWYSKSKIAPRWYSSSEIFNEFEVDALSPIVININGEQGVLPAIEVKHLAINKHNEAIWDFISLQTSLLLPELYISSKARMFRGIRWSEELAEAGSSSIDDILVIAKTFDDNVLDIAEVGLKNWKTFENRVYSQLKTMHPTKKIGSQITLDITYVENGISKTKTIIPDDLIQIDVNGVMKYKVIDAKTSMQDLVNKPDLINTCTAHQKDIYPLIDAGGTNNGITITKVEMRGQRAKEAFGFNLFDVNTGRAQIQLEKGVEFWVNTNNTDFTQFLIRQRIK